MMHLKKKNRKLLTEYGNATQQHGWVFFRMIGEKKEKQTNSCKTDLMSHIEAICLVKINHQY